MTIFNLVNSDLAKKDPKTVHDLLGDPDDGDVSIEFTDDWTMEDVCIRLGLFPSKSQARKNGWGGPIPPGYSEHVFGKRHRLYIVNKSPNWDRSKLWWYLLWQEEAIASENHIGV